jgi:hypothetical protein
MFVHTLHIIRASTYFAAICRLLGLKSVTTPQTGLPHRLPRPFEFVADQIRFGMRHGSDF